MAPSSSERTGLWHGTVRADTHPPLQGDADTEVAVVGGGITGLTTGLVLAEAGRRVTVLEARGLASGTTGGTTGKLTSQHGMIYADLIERHGEATARVYAQLNQAAIRQTEQLCHRHGIDAELTSADAYVYADSEDQVASARRELEAARSLGLPAEWSEETELPLRVAGAVRFTGQAHLHPVAHVNGLASALADTPGCEVHTETRVVSLRERGGRVALTTNRGQVVADHVVLATLAPLTDRGFEFARTTPMRSYGIAATVDGGVPHGMYISAGEPSWSIHHYDGDEQTYLIVVDQSHRVGHGGESTADAALEEFAREHFDVRDVAYRWSAQDFVPADRLPFIGTTALSRRIHVATGFQKWGLTNAMVAARLLDDVIAGRENPNADLFSPTRTTVGASARSFVEHNLDVAARFIGDRFAPDATSVDEIPPGGGGTVRVGGELLAVARNDDGTVTTRSAVCTHLGCIVQWNGAERSWDCPCHGSRFSPTGDVLDGPATEPLGDA